MLRLFRPDLSVASGVCVLTGQLLALGRLPSGRAMGLGFLSIFMLAGTALVLLAVAGGFYFRSGQPDRAPTDSYVGFYCAPCRHFYRLSEREIEGVWDRREYRAGENRQVRFKCPQCGQFTAERADGPPTDPNAPS